MSIKHEPSYTIADFLTIITPSGRVPAPMKKEVILAIVIGFGVGLLITFGIYTARTALEEKSTTNQQSPTPQDLTSDSTPSSSLNISTPKHEDLVDTETISIEGQAPPESIITIILSTGQQVITSDKNGIFKTTVELNGGANEINITAFTKEGEKSETSLTIVYTTAQI